MSYGSGLGVYFEDYNDYEEPDNFDYCDDCGAVWVSRGDCHGNPNEICKTCHGEGGGFNHELDCSEYIKK